MSIMTLRARRGATTTPALPAPEEEWITLARATQVLRETHPDRRPSPVRQPRLTRLLAGTR